MKTTIKVDMRPASAITKRLGIDRNGDVQRFVTHTVNRRITRYMPYRTGTLATKLKIVTGPTEITVLGPYARYQYYGKVMVGKAPRTVTDKDLQYTKSKNLLAGPFWDRRMMAAEGAQIREDIQKYVRRRSK